jgi:non-canonical purine NTP pyrophosphatase (RdgB/HAM1 family)
MNSSNKTLLTFATSSSWKYQQGQAYLENRGIALQQAAMELSESRSEDVLEIAKEKAAYAYNILKRPVIVIDGAFHIKALDGFPKTLVKFSEKYIGASGVMKLMQDKEERSYEWPNVLCYHDATTEKCFVGYIRGQIIKELPANTKTNDFGLIQVPNGYTKTFANMTAEELHHFEQNVWSPTLFQEFSEWYANSIDSY